MAMATTRRKALGVLLSVALSLGCYRAITAGEPGNARDSTAAEDYIADNWEDFLWFRDAPVGRSGIPYLIFQLFPDVMPDIWHSQWPEEVGFFRHPDPQRHLPHGLGWGPGSTPIVDIPGFRNIRVQIVNLSCASCHTGRVIDAEGKPRVLVGAPSTQLDVGLWRHKLAQTVRDPRFSFENFEAALARKQSGWLYPESTFGLQEWLDTKVFRKRGREIIEVVGKRVEKTYDGFHELLGSMGYDERSKPYVSYGARGQLEGGFGSAVTKLVPEEYMTLPIPERVEKLKEYFPANRIVVDIMSVWGQDQRRLGQWDGNIRPKLLRNLGAELGVVPDPNLISFENALAGTRFVGKLPGPAWPFDRPDPLLVQNGARIFARSCAQCHNGDTPVIPQSVVGTDSNRLPGISERGRIAISEMVLRACRDRSIPDCNVSIEEVISDTRETMGYIAGPLDGVWARAPYLHNGSVPTLAQLLKPGTRANTFYRGNIEYDTQEVGFEWRKAQAHTQLYDTGIAGYGNQGHGDPDVFFGGIRFEEQPEKLAELLAYLKTL
jgi:hypothetical protein